VFGLIDLKLTYYFLLRSDTRSRGHQYKLFFQAAVHRQGTASLLTGQQGCGMACQKTALTFLAFHSLNV